MVACLYNLSTGETGVGRRTIKFEACLSSLVKPANKQATLEWSPDLFIFYCSSLSSMASVLCSWVNCEPPMFTTRSDMQRWLGAFPTPGPLPCSPDTIYEDCGKYLPGGGGKM